MAGTGDDYWLPVTRAIAMDGLTTALFVRKGQPAVQLVGGEERFWLGPEGGLFSLYFKEGQEQVYDNW